MIKTSGWFVGVGSLARLLIVGLVIFGSGFVWAQTGSNRIAFTDPQGRLATVAADGSDLRVLSGLERRFQFPAWSPDDSLLAAIAVDAQGGAVYITPDAESAELNELYRSRSETPFYLYWAPDSQSLGFLANHPSGLGLHLASVDDADSRLRLTGRPFYWQWSADSRELLIHSGFSGPSASLGFISALGAFFMPLTTNLSLARANP